MIFAFYIPFKCLTEHGNSYYIFFYYYCFCMSKYSYTNIVPELQNFFFYIMHVNCTSSLNLNWPSISSRLFLSQFMLFLLKCFHLSYFSVYSFIDAILLCVYFNSCHHIHWHSFVNAHIVFISNLMFWYELLSLHK